MKEGVAVPGRPMSASDYERAVDEVLAEIRALNERMDNDRSEIERLNVETRRLKEETRSILAGMGCSF